MSRHYGTRGWLWGLGLAVAVTGLACRANPDVAKREYLKSGDRYVEEKKYSEAIVQYRNALQQDPKFGEARYKLAETYAKQGDGPGALREYVRAADLLPANVDAQVKAAGLLLLARQFEDAKTRAQKALAKDPKNVQAQIVLGSALAGLNDFDAAIKQLEEANKLQPTVGAYAGIGAIESARGAQPDAEKAFRAAVAVDPKNVGGHLALANYLMAAGRRPEAEVSLKQALSLDPANNLANRALVALYIGSNRARDAEPYLKKLAENDVSPGATYKIALAEYFAQTSRPGDALKILAPLAAGKQSFAPSQTRVAAIQYVQKDASLAHKTLDAVLAREPKNEEALLMKTRFLMRERKLDEALKRAQTATAVNPQSVGAFYLVGMIQRARRQPAEAIAAFGEVLRLNPRAVAAKLQLSELNLATGHSEAGLQLAQDAANALPTNPLIQLNLARNLIARNEIARADPIVKQLVSKYPKDAAALAIAGTLALAKKDFPAARASYDTALSVDPVNLEAVGGLTSLDVAQKNLAQARARIDGALATSPANVDLLLLSGRLFATSGDLPSAEASFRKVIDTDPAVLQAYGLLAALYVRQKKLDLALAECDRLSEKQPSAIGPRTLAAMIVEGQGKVDDARQRYEKILQIDSTAAVAANNLAYIYARQGSNLDVALQLAQTAKIKLPDQPEVNDTLGFIYLKKDMASMAVPPLEAAVLKDPNSPISKYHLGMAYAKAGQTEKARTALEQALTLNPSFDGANDAKALLARLNRLPS